MADERHDRRRRVEYVLGACQVFRAEAQEAAGEIDRGYWFGPDDADWCFSIREAGFDVLYIPDAEVVHDYRRSSAASPVSLMAARHLIGHLRFQAKWWRRRRRLRAQGAALDVEAAAEARPS
jgi:GT2 family glycosyltransferase